PAQRGAGLLGLGELDELLERQPEQVAQPDQLLQPADIRLGIGPVRPLLTLRSRPEQPELFVVADRPRRDADALRHLADAEGRLCGAHAATSTSRWPRSEEH